MAEASGGAAAGQALGQTAGVQPGSASRRCCELRQVT